MHIYKTHILVCEDNIDDIYNELIVGIEKNKLTQDVKVIKTKCLELCGNNSIIIVYPEGTIYENVNKKDVEEIINEHLIKGIIVKRLLVNKSSENNNSYESADFFKKQTRIALRNCGVINPEIIDEYIAYDGYKALATVLTTMKPDEVIDIVLESGIRGRGGAGFLTGKKWLYTAKAKGNIKYVCCNADEGDPGAFMDRSVLEGDPHSVIEAMAIAGYAIGSNQGYIYVRAEYPIAVKRLNIAIAQAKKLGLLGNNIFNSNFSFNLELRLGAGAFVCGEETALMTSIEGKRGEPRPRPPFPAIKGLFQKPTVLNNVETLANIPMIINKGAKWFKSIGTANSPGTKVFAIGGKINNTGLVEIPMGTTLRKVIYDIGGGIPNGKKFKAAQTGGPSGGCIPAKYLDIPIEYETLSEIGSMMGSGGLIVMDEDNCMVDIAKFFLEFSVDESCGKCPPCRIGTKRMYEILERITKGKGQIDDIAKLEELALVTQSSSLCGLGKTAANPILSTLKYFRHEYEEHILEKKCRAGVCKELLDYTIIASDCKGCTKCKKVCPANAISGQIKKAHVIDQSKCIKCGMCFEACPFDAIIRA